MLPEEPEDVELPEDVPEEVVVPVEPPVRPETPEVVSPPPNRSLSLPPPSSTTSATMIRISLLPPPPEARWLLWPWADCRCEEEAGRETFTFSYDVEDSIEEKLNALATRIYGGKGAVLTPNAKKQAEQLTALGYGKLPICVAKTQYSFSDDPTLLGAPEDFVITVRNLKVSAGAGFLVALTGEILTMPGLPKSPAAERIDVTDDGRITGLF